MSESVRPADDAPPHGLPLSLLLFGLTLLTATRVGSLSNGATSWAPGELAKGLSYSLPLMAILLSHELGHYIAARLWRVPTSMPFFIPMPWSVLGTMGAVILMPPRIKRRDALLDIGAAGPLAGMVVALPVLIYGILQSKVAPLPTDTDFLVQEGHSLLYSGLLYWLKGPIPPGQDIMLSPTAFAGWSGLLVTMINLIPSVQLDGGHVAYALFGPRQQRYSKLFRLALLPLGVGVSLYYGLSAWQAGRQGDELLSEFGAGGSWLLWSLVLHLIAWRSPNEHPPTDDGELSPRRRWVAVLTLALFVLLFMPSWLRVVPLHH